MKSVEVSSTEIALHLGLEARGTTATVKRIAPLDEPESGALTFCLDPHSQHLAAWEGKRGTIIAPAEASVPGDCAHIVSTNARGDYATTVRQFLAPDRAVGIAQTACVHSSVEVGADVFIGENSVIEEGVVLGDRTTIGHNTTVLRNSHIGNDVSIGHNTVIGSVGFGLEEDATGNWVRIPHLGNVVIESNVEIGSSSVIARGTIKETRIGKNCKIDDNVFIAHNVRISQNSVVIANAEVSGSVRIGENCWVGPAVTILEKVTIGDNAFIGLGSVVIRDVPAGKVVVGNPSKVLRDR